MLSLSQLLANHRGERTIKHELLFLALVSLFGHAGSSVYVLSVSMLAPCPLDGAVVTQSAQSVVARVYRQVAINTTLQEARLCWEQNSTLNLCRVSTVEGFITLFFSLFKTLLVQRFE